MPDVSPKTLQDIREALLATCESVKELERRDVLSTWRAWNDAFPLRPKQHREILEGTVVKRLSNVPIRLRGRHAIRAYESQSGFGVIVLCEGALVAWSCTGRRVPTLDNFDAELVVTNLTFDWSFGLHANWRTVLAEPVFVDREMLEQAALITDD